MAYLDKIMPVLVQDNDLLHNLTVCLWERSFSFEAGECRVSAPTVWSVCYRLVGVPLVEPWSLRCVRSSITLGFACHARLRCTTGCFCKTRKNNLVWLWEMKTQFFPKLLYNNLRFQSGCSFLSNGRSCCLQFALFVMTMAPKARWWYSINTQC